MLGWVVPLEDKPGLLELEAKKMKERDETAKQKAVDSNTSSKENSKSIGKRFQEVFGKIKSFF